MINDRQNYKPGQLVEVGGIYDLCEHDGTRTGYVVEVEENEHFPPADRRGQVYRRRA